MLSLSITIDRPPALLQDEQFWIMSDHVRFLKAQWDVERRDLIRCYIMLDNH